MSTGNLELVQAPVGLAVTLAETRLHLLWDDDDTSQDQHLTDDIVTATTYIEQEIMGHRQFLPAVYDLPVSDWWDGELEAPRPPLQSVVSVTYYDADDASQTLSSSYYTVRTPWRQPGAIEFTSDAVLPPLSSNRRYPVKVRFLAGYYATVTADATTNVLTTAGRPLANGERVQVHNYGGGVPGGLTAGNYYYVVNASALTFKLASTAGGSAIDLTDAGTGTNYVGSLPTTLRKAILMMVGHYDSNREAIIAGPRMTATEIPMGVEALCRTEAWGSYR